ncbi:hypothetical protein KP509_33G036100 [Ceratopteris richardii]|uniref:VQ domain-containing protein n=1 Tax=Ceratopteris richardii TaxID=49495 RepID=A0A8T2QNL5_CERRI|nr:hypothetical protein KP509_33G036100 [Ceratopteris richardii]
MKRQLEQQKQKLPPLKIVRQESQAAPPRQRQPVIVYTYSPKTIKVDVCDFMRLVQTLTGQSAEAGKKASLILSEQPTDTHQSISSRGSDASVLTEDVPDEAHSAFCDKTPDIYIGPEAAAINNADNSAVNAMPSTIKLLPPFAKPSMFASRCASQEDIFSYSSSSWITERAEPASPSLLSPSFFDLSACPSSFWNQLSPFPRSVNDSTNFY